MDRLQLDDLEIQDLAALFAISGELSALSIVNSSIPDFSDLLACNPCYLTLEGVKIRSNTCTIQGKLPGHLKLLNMHVDARALNCFCKK